MEEIERIKTVQSEIEAEFLKHPGVIGVGIGYKYINGKKTDELAICVFVEEKKDVPKNQEIPKEIKGIKTDVKVRPKIKPMRSVLKTTEITPQRDDSSYSVIVGGISIGPCRSIYIDAADAACREIHDPGNYIFVGTLGLMVRDIDTGDDMFLSNYHVMCLDDHWNVGDQICQPSRNDGGNCPGDVIGTVQRAHLGGTVDCAVADFMSTTRTHRCVLPFPVADIADIGIVTGPATAVEDSNVQKRGRTTGHTFGIVEHVNTTISVNYCNGLGTIIFTGQIEVLADTQNDSFIQGGDSGSVLINDNSEVVGLMFAGTGEVTDSAGHVIIPEGRWGYANPIQDVLDTLNVRICSSTRLKSIVEESKAIIIDVKSRYQEKFVDKLKELKDFKEFKEKDYKEVKDKEKDIYEGWDKRAAMEGPGSPFEKRIRNLESTVNKLKHFIPPENRPELSKSALKNEKDLSKKKEER